MFWMSGVGENLNWCDTSRISKCGNIGTMSNVLTAFEIVILSLLENFVVL